MDIRESMIKALRKRYEAVIEEAKATAEIYLERPVGIGEHPQFIQELDKLMSKIAEAISASYLRLSASINDSRIIPSL